MVNFSVFNELSLPFENNLNIEDEFVNFFKLLKTLESKNLNKIRLDKSFREYDIIQNVNFQQFMGQSTNSTFTDRLREFLSNQVIKLESPLIKEDEEEAYDTITSHDYLFEDSPTIGGLACADIWNTIAVSFNSHIKWNQDSISIQRNNQPIAIKHASQSVHINSHQLFLDELEQELKLGISKENFWERREEFFSKIIFCEEVEKQIAEVDKNIFERDISFFRDIETEKKSLQDFQIHNEGETVKTNLKLRALREFYIDGKIEFFEKHIIKSSGHRIHFFEKGDKIYIGYIGKHLRTAKF
ncbi:MAG: hypothetical protein M1300_09280 [Epsilonproteobacteria bacterium]|nr:hypothetical protein [Campylobacterota bacterium]